MDQGQYYIPEYQRDSAEWDVPKKSLFVESLINNLTVPPIIVYPEDDPSNGLERRQVVDGQQRLTTIHDFVHDKFELSPEAEVEYADNVGPLIQGKKFSALPVTMQRQIEGYIINIIVLPKFLELPLRLEIFRRINEGGVPLSAHDLRLATFGESKRVYFIRMAGIFDQTRDGSARMIQAGKLKHRLDYPWKNSSAWKSWWDETTHASGQAPSQMYLYYVIARDMAAVEAILASEKTQQSLKLKYDRTTISVLDLYLAQAENEERTNTARIVADLPTLVNWFIDFEQWFSDLKSSKVPSVPVNSSTKVAFFIAAASAHWESPTKVTERQWELIQLFLTQGPTRIKQELGLDYTATRGKWPGQKKQIDQTYAICQKIALT